MKRVALWAFPVALVLCYRIPGQVNAGCLVKGEPVTLRGTLSRVDENGYRQWIALRPARPICASADPTDQYDKRVDHVVQIQIFDGDKVDVRSRLNRLIGKNAALSGKLVEWHTGYQRAAVVLDVRTVEATDADGMAALSVAEPSKATVREVMAYDVIVRAGRSLTKKAREVATDDRLSPVDDYAPHWVTGGDVVYVDCRDGYERNLISSTDQRGFCPDDDLCGFNAYPATTTVIKFHCVKKTM